MSSEITVSGIFSHVVRVSVKPLHYYCSTLPLSYVIVSDKVAVLEKNVHKWQYRVLYTVTSGTLSLCCCWWLIWNTLHFGPSTS